MKKFLKNNSYLFLAVLALVLLWTTALYQSYLKDPNLVRSKIEHKIREFQNQRQILTDQAFSVLSSDDTLALFSAFHESTSQLNHTNAGILVFKDGRLIYWTDDRIPFEEIKMEEIPPNGMVFLKNGWYLCEVNSRHSYDIISYNLIFINYSHQNQYLKNGLSSAFETSFECQLDTVENTSAIAIHDSNGTFLFSLAPQSSQESAATDGLNFLFFTLFLMFITIWLERKWMALSEKNPALKVFSIISLIGIGRYLMISFQFPALLYDTDIFNPSNYAYSFLFSSEGDLLLNSLIALYFVYLLNKYIFSNLNRVRQPKKWMDWVAVLLITTLLFLLAALISQLIEGVVENSTINFDVSDVFGLSYLSILGLFTFGLLYFVYLLILDKLIGWLVNKGLAVLPIAITYAATCVVGFAVFSLEKSTTDALSRALWSLPLFLLILYYKRGKWRHYSFSNLIVIVLLFSFTASLIISNGSFKMELQKREHLLNNLATNEDPVAEYLFNEMSKELRGDNYLIDNSVNFWTKEAELRQWITERYFSGYWDKYDIQFVACQEDDSIFITNLNFSDNCQLYFQQKIEEITEPTSYPNLYHERTKDGVASYIGQVDLAKGENNIKLYIEFRSKTLIKNEGYPELLLGQKEIDRSFNLQDYSFARYYKGALINSSGTFNYAMQLPNKFVPGEREYYVEEGFTHLLVENADGIAIILSRKDNQFFQTSILFSFLFSLLLILFFALSLSISDFPVQHSFSLISFGSKLQLLLIGVILIVAIPIGIGVSYYVQRHHDDRNNKTITEKISSVLTEMEHKIGEEEFIPTDIPDNFKNYLDQILIKFSNVFYTDINLYSLEGRLIATSRSEVFDIGLKGKQMNSEAYHAVAQDNKSLYIHNESIGSLTYLSAYVPFKNNENELLAYLNLPYFAKQYELEKELSSILLALVNIYIFLIALTIIVSVFITDYLTKPLKLIGSKIRKLKLGGENELIQWKGEDEIGSLVKEYNRMVNELANNVELLAQSEREGAWREMAKQVAHEIKNPLTPMKLSIQHLQRSAADNPDTVTSRIEKVSKTLIEQIESLTRIADEFSNFAQMPPAKNESLQIIEVLKSSLDLYQDQKIQIELTERNLPPHFKVSGDRDQLMRVFNNIIKNAIQSIPDDREGLIRVDVSREKDKAVIRINDNGIGMTEEEKQRIFVPNFTTKSGGMGLGLAMVKNIIESGGGVVSFTSKLGIGTEFVIEIPLLEE